MEETKYSVETLPGYADLDDRERKVLGYLLEGKRPKEISFILICATRTAEQHRMNVFRKLGVENEEELKSLASKTS